MAGFDPNLVNQALAMQGATYRVPVDTAQPLTPEEAALGQIQAANAAAEDLYVANNPSHMGGAPMLDAQPAVQPPIPIDWVPQQEQAQQPMLPVEQQAAPSPEMAPPQQQAPRQGGGVANPITGMLADTTARRQAAEAESAGYERLGDEAVASGQEAAAELGQVRSDAAGEVAAIQERAAAEGAQYVEQLADIQDSRDKASSRVEDEQREYAKFIGDYEPKDRRTMATRVMGAIAVGLGQMTDQNNLVAGLMQGVNVQTNNADATSALIQRGIDRDIDMQRAMLDNKRTALAAKTTELGQVRAKFGDDVDTLKLARAMKLDQAIQETEAAKSRGMSAEATALADATIANLQLERANTLMGVKEQNFQRYLGQEQQLKMVRAQQAAGPKQLSAKERLDLEGKALANEKARRELEDGPGDRKLTEGQAKLKRDIIGAQDDIRQVAKMLGGDMPYVGVRGAGNNAPDLLTPTENIKLRNAILSAHDVAMRDKSGAAIGKEERAADLESLGVFSGDPAVAAEGIKKLNRRVIERAKEVGVDPAELGLIDPETADLTRPLSR